MKAVALRAVALLLLSGCANQSAPPGGPPDLAPPLLLKVTPQNNTVGGTPKAVVLQFDEVVSESPMGAKDIADLVFISPKSGVPKVNWGRSKIEIRPSKGWKPNTVYSVVIKRGLQDLRNNGIDSTIQLVFSTGGAIPSTSITGVAFDWPAGKGLSGALIEAIALDSTTYQVVSDSAGRFDLRYAPVGPYTLRAYDDRNKNRTLDPLELWDTVSVTLTQSASAELYAFGHDTVGLRISDVSLVDSARGVKITFDKPYAPTQIFDQGSIVVTRPDSTPVPIRLIRTVAQRAMADSLIATARRDSIDRAAARRDSTPALRARSDSLARVRRADSVAAASRTERAAREARRVAAARGGRTLGPIDTTPPPKMRRPAVFNEVFVTFDTTLPPQTQFRVTVKGIRSLSGTVRSPERTFSTPKAPKVDSTAVRRDSTAVRRDTTAVRRDTLGRR
jgi:hypothetical protein